MLRTERRRLDPAILNLPVEKMRDGYYSDTYFNRAREILEADRYHPRVRMQVFQRNHSHPVRDRRGDRDPQAVQRPPPPGRHVGRRLGRADGERAVRRRPDRAVRDGDDDRGRLRAVRAPRDAVSRRARAPHAHRDERARDRRRRRRQRSAVLPRAVRPPSRADRRRLRRVHLRRAGRVDRRERGVVGLARDGHGPARADRGVRRRHGARDRKVRAVHRPVGERDRAGGLRQRLRGHVGRGRARARRPPMGRAARHVGHAGRQERDPADGHVPADGRQRAARAQRARRARRAKASAR